MQHMAISMAVPQDKYNYLFSNFVVIGNVQYENHIRFPNPPVCYSLHTSFSVVIIKYL